MGKVQKVREILCKGSSGTSKTNFIYIEIFLDSALLSLSFSPDQDVELALSFQML